MDARSLPASLGGDSQALGYLVACYRRNCKLLVAGPGAAEVVGMLEHGFGASRPLQADLLARLREFGPGGEALAGGLHGALPAIVVEGEGPLGVAQRVLALGQAGDVLLALGPGLVQAVQVARARGLKTIAVGATADGWCDVALPAGDRETLRALCRALEATFFPG